jgi:hypothetical protein
MYIYIKIYVYKFICIYIHIGHCIDFLNRNVQQVMTTSRVGVTAALCDLFNGLTSGKASIDISQDVESRIEKIWLYCLAW